MCRKRERRGFLKYRMVVDLERNVEEGRKTLDG